MFFILFNFLIFLFREIYLILSFFLTFIYFYQNKKINKFLPVFLLDILIIFIFVFLNDFKSFYLQMIKINLVRIVDNINFYSDNINIIRSLFYPFFILFGFKWNILKIILVMFSLLFIFLSFYLLYKRKINFYFFCLIWIVLGLSLIRSFTPGTIYYGSYRGMIWSGFLLVSSLYLIKIFNKKIYFFLSLFIFLLIFIFDKNYFLFKKNNKLQSFNINYNKFFLTSEIINKLANKNDQIFIDGYASLIFSLINIRSNYKYIFYYPVVEKIQPFEYEKEKSLLYQPTFYYIDCVDLKTKEIPKTIHDNYLEFYYQNKKFKTCLFINKNKINNIKKEKLKEIRDVYGYVLLTKNQLY